MPALRTTSEGEPEKTALTFQKLFLSGISETLSGDPG